MSYGSNWFKACRTLFLEARQDKVPHDFFILITILDRVRYNGNNNQFQIGEAFIGLDEIAKLTRTTRQMVRSSLKRLQEKHVITVIRATNQGTVIRVNYASMYMNDQTTHQPSIKHQSTTNVDKIRKEREHIPPQGNTFSTIKEEIKKAFPKRNTPHPWTKGFAKLDSQLETNEDWGRFMKACCNYGASMLETGNVGTQFVKSFETFCTKGNWEDWVDVEAPAPAKEMY